MYIAAISAAVIQVHADAVAAPDIRIALVAAVDRAGGVIAQLLALAELERPIEAGGTVVDLHALAEKVVVDRAPAILASGRTIALERNDESASVSGYPEALVSALENLVDNATRHTPPGTAIEFRSGPDSASPSATTHPPFAHPTLHASGTGWGAAPERMLRVQA